MDVSDDFGFPIDVRALADRSTSYLSRCEDVPDAGRRIGPLSKDLCAEILSAVDGWLCPSINDELSIDPDSAVTRALDAIERSRQAWLGAVKARDVRPMLAAQSLADLVWLKYELERAFPTARCPSAASFVSQTFEVND
jgi:hypothetical protein